MALCAEDGLAADSQEQQFGFFLPFPRFIPCGQMWEGNELNVFENNDEEMNTHGNTKMQLMAGIRG